MKEFILDHEERHEFIQNSIKWWEKKRIIFNIVVILAFIAPSILGFKGFYANKAIIFELVEVTAWIIGANLFYCLGIGAELTIQFHRKKESSNIRTLLFILGMLFSTFWSFWGSLI